MNATTIDSMFGVMLLEASVLAKATTGAAVVVVADGALVVVARSVVVAGMTVHPLTTYLSLELHTVATAVP
jgi:argonaute-like protein implicated in RNA metabolism and viral defense